MSTVVDLESSDEESVYDPPANSPEEPSSPASVPSRESTPAVLLRSQSPSPEDLPPSPRDDALWALAYAFIYLSRANDWGCGANDICNIGFALDDHFDLLVDNIYNGGTPTARATSICSPNVAKHLAKKQLFVAYSKFVEIGYMTQLDILDIGAAIWENEPFRLQAMDECREMAMRGEITWWAEIGDSDVVTKRKKANRMKRAAVEESEDEAEEAEEAEEVEEETEVLPERRAKRKRINYAENDDDDWLDVE